MNTNTISATITAELAAEEAADRDLLEKAYQKSLGLAVQLGTKLQCPIANFSLRNQLEKLFRHTLIHSSVYQLGSEVQLLHNLVEIKHPFPHVEAIPIINRVLKLNETLQSVLDSESPQLEDVHNQTTFSAVIDALKLTTGITLDTTFNLEDHQAGDITYRNVSGFNLELRQWHGPSRPGPAKVVETTQMILDTDVEGIYNAVLTAIREMQTNMN
jgi:hypothetical protein